MFENGELDKVKAERQAINVFMDMLVQLCPEEEKPVFEAPRVISTLNEKISSLLEIITNTTSENGAKTDVAAKVVDFCNDLINQTDIFIDSINCGMGKDILPFHNGDYE